MSYNNGPDNLDIKHSRFFIKNLISFLIPVLIPVLILGAFSIIITYQYIQSNIDINNENLLRQIRFQVDTIFEEIESIHRGIANNPEINDKLKKILQSRQITVNDYMTTRYVSNFLNAQEQARPYINSIYLYYENNKNHFMTTTEGLIVDDDYFDMKWMEEYLENKETKERWQSYRRLYPHGYRAPSIDVITLYWVMETDNNPDGVLVLNINASYIEQLLQNMDTLSEQYILVQAEKDSILFSNQPLSYLGELDMLYTLQADKEGILKSQLKSKLYDWTYHSVVPVRVIYRMPLRITKILVSLLIILILLGFIVSYYLTKRNYTRIKNIMDIINYAEQGKELPVVKEELKDEYSYITNKIIKTFIQNSYLKLQVSEKAYQQKTLELLALQAQINPHFLYNTLETIYWKVFQFTGYPNQVNKMLENLSDILKYSLHQPQKKVKISEEINYTKSYIEIQKIRYKEKFNVYWEYSEAIINKEIIKLVLQPLVENSIYYGIKEKEGECGIKIKIIVIHDMIKVSIIDNGIGMEIEQLKEMQERLNNSDSIKIDRIGLCNTSKRLILLYGYSSRIHIRSKRGLGTVVFFKIPIQE